MSIAGSREDQFKDLIDEVDPTLLKGKIVKLPQAILYKASKGELVPQLNSDGEATDLLREIENLKSKV